MSAHRIARRKKRRKTTRARRKYDELYSLDPLAANTWLLLAERAGPDGRIRFGPDLEGEVAMMLADRFEDPDGYHGSDADVIGALS